MFSTDVFAKAKNDEQKPRVEIQASFTLESVSDGKQTFSLENLYIILPEKIESVQKNTMEFLFKNETKKTNDTITTPVKPITKTIPSAPVKSSSNVVDGSENNNKNCACIVCTWNHNSKEHNKQFYAHDLVGLYMKYDSSITYEDFLMKRESVTSKDKPFHLQINDYLSAKVVEKRENTKRLWLLQKLFDQNKYQWKDEYLNVYNNWSANFKNVNNLNRYKKMVQFINENRSDFTKTI